MFRLTFFPRCFLLTLLTNALLDMLLVQVFRCNCVTVACAFLWNINNFRFQKWKFTIKSGLFVTCMHLFNVSNYKCQTKEHVRNVAFSALNRKGQSHCERSLSKAEVVPEVVQEVISVLYLDDQRVKLLNGSSKYRCVAFFYFFERLRPWV